MSRYAQQRDRYGRLVCNCMGYWFPHRKGGGACDHSPSRDYHEAIRTGLPRVEAESMLWSYRLQALRPPVIEWLPLGSIDVPLDEPGIKSDRPLF